MGSTYEIKPSKSHENNCHKYYMKSHWSRTYHKPKHLTDLYQASIKEKEKEIEINFTNRNELDLTYYDIDFFGGPSEKTDYLMNDENIACNTPIPPTVPHPLLWWVHCVKRGEVSQI